MSKPIYYSDLPLEKNEVFAELLKISADAIASLKYRAENPHGQSPAEHETAKKLYAKYAGSQSAVAPTAPSYGFGDAPVQQPKQIKRDVVSRNGRHYVVNTIVNGQGKHETAVFPSDLSGNITDYTPTHQMTHSDEYNALMHHNKVVKLTNMGVRDWVAPVSMYAR